jgi:tRNA (guanine-N1)-methyltransferase
MSAPWQATVLTIFPEMLPGPLGHSLAGKALADGIWSLETVNPRDFATDRHKSVDDIPFGALAPVRCSARIVAALPSGGTAARTQSVAIPALLATSSAAAR